VSIESNNYLVHSTQTHQKDPRDPGSPESSVVHEPARAESRPGLEPARLVDPWTRGLEPSPDLDSRTRARLEPPRNRQETAKRLESRVESARGPLSEPARAAKRLESARGPLFEPPRDRLPRDSSRLESSPDLGSSRLGSWHPRARRARAMLGSSLARVRLARAQHYQRAPCMTRSPISSPRPTYRHDGRPRSGQVAPS